MLSNKILSNKILSNKILSYWSVPAYLPYVQHDLTDERIKNAEKTLGVTLPKEYIDLLKVQNGGYIRYKLDGFPHSVTYGIGGFYPNLTDLDWSDYEGYVSFELNGLIPFDGDGHWYLCFDYRGNENEPQITYIDTEVDTEQIVANTFSDYLTKLIVETDDLWVIETNEKIGKIINNIETILQVKFEEPDTWAHGYPIYRCEYNEGWIWVSPNNVLRGFVRRDDDRYEELIKKTEGNALRYPELHENDILVSFSEEDDANHIIDSLKKNAINTNIRPLSEYIANR